MKPCPFCEIIAGNSDTLIVYQNAESVCFQPLNPVTKGHLLVVPRQHAERLHDLSWGLLAGAMRLVQVVGLGRDYNLIQSNGAAATQTVPHVHFHIVPRFEGDGLHLPWTGQVKAE